MSSIPLPRLDTVRCAQFHAALGADPIGSAGAYDAFLFVEVPLPWGRDIAAHEPFASLGAGTALVGADGRTWRPQGVVPRDEDGDSGGASVRVLAMDQTQRPAAGPYRRREWRVGTERVIELCRALLADDDAALEGFTADAVQDRPELVDLFVCTHGRRDVCCGGDGTRLHAELDTALAEDGSVRLWRVSHTGGHKFAPTALSFPDGCAWAHLDLGAALAVARRDSPPTRVLGHCRGVASLPPLAQVADRELFARAGWSWVNGTRRAQVVERGDLSRGAEVRIDAVTVDGRSVTAMVQVESDREILQPTCGVLPDEPAPVVPVWRVARVDPIPPVQ